ncbi:OmpH family outer membrane protein [Holosporaceae bacterium 'Namur']|nr:OmpH family outer membrane protein [Holosporaceae bacterium 'Namur']
MRLNIKQFIITLPLITTLNFLPNLASAKSDNFEGNRIAVVDFQKIDNESKAVKSIREQADKKWDAAKKEAADKEKELKKKFSELENNKRKLSKDAYDQEEEKLGREAEGFQKKSYEKRMKIERATAEAMAQVEKTIREIIQKKAKEESYTLILYKMSTIYSNERLDITSGILAELDKALPKVEVKFSK